MIEYYELVNDPANYPDFNELDLLNYQFNTQAEAESFVSDEYTNDFDDGDIIDVYIVLVQCNDNGDVQTITEVNNLSFTKYTEPSDLKEHGTWSI